MRRKTRVIKVGSVLIGGNNPIPVQSMTKTPTKDVKKTVAQILSLEKTGCQIVRCAVPDEESARSLKKIKSQIHIPLVADIHFDYKLALVAIDSGIDKLRINPGNIGSQDKIQSVVSACKAHKIPIRIGVNSGSLDKKYSHPTAQNLAESALENVALLEKQGFYEIIIAVKSTSIPVTLEAYRILSQKVDYPLHIGITESGSLNSGMIRSSVGIGALLAEGIGDTLRVSLTAPPEKEVLLGYDILKALELYKSGVTIISCPTCGRCEINLTRIADAIEREISRIKAINPLKIAIMGCVVNGPGEAKEADLGLAGGKGQGLIFVKGEIVKKVAEKDMVSEFIKIFNQQVKKND